MNIVHIAPNSPYNEGWGYQDNLLPKYQAKLGHNVTLVITNLEHHNGKLIQTYVSDYKSNSGYRVIRKRVKHIFNDKCTDFFSKLEVYDLLRTLNPDLVFYHGMESITIFQVVRFKKKINPNLKIVQDNHADYNLGYTPSAGIKAYIFCMKNRLIFKFTQKYIDKVYGVTPWRKKYAEEVVHVPSSMTDVLLMGADDDNIHYENRYTIRNKIRVRYGIKDTDFLIVTGGKIDQQKKIDILMKACDGMIGVKLLIFGNVNFDIKSEFEKIACDSQNIIYVGWIDSSEVYDYFFACDLVFFPGQHSVLWEQACASKVPCVFEQWEGMQHVNNGGNSEFISPVNEITIRSKILELKFTERYDRMKKIAESNATDIYLYSSIAYKSLECTRGNQGC